MPIPSPLARAHSHPKLISSLVADNFFNDTTTIQQRVQTRTSKGGITYTWPTLDVDDVVHVDIPCVRYDRLPTEQRTIELIEELKYWTILLAGHFPNIDPTCRCQMGSDSKIFDIVGIDSDSLHIYTVLTVRDFVPEAETGV